MTNQQEPIIYLNNYLDGNLYHHIEFLMKHAL